jgi:heme exporter protein D
MRWTTLTEFLAMGGYGGYVWPAFAAAALVLVGLGLDSRRRLRAALAELEAAEREQAGRPGGRRRQSHQGQAPVNDIH